MTDKERNPKERQPGQSVADQLEQIESEADVKNDGFRYDYDDKSDV